jgi:membrane protein CcdC involved in cytochrome C biogenesis
MLWSMTAMAAAGVAVFVLRFWRQTGDRLFALMALAFGLLSANTTLLAAINPAHESRHLIYILRLAAFLVLIIAIVDKNRDRA